MRAARNRYAVRRFAAVRFAAPLVGVLIAAPTQAGDEPAPAPAVGTIARVAAPPAGDEPTALPMSLAEALASGLERNLPLEIERHQPWIAREQQTAAFGAYDPVLGGEFGYESSETPTGNSLVGTVPIGEKTTDGKAGVGGLVPWLGASYGVNYVGSRLITNSRIASFSPENRATLVGTLTLPLLREFLHGGAWTEYRVRRLGVEAADEGFRRALMDTVLRIEAAYWELVAARENRRVARKSVETTNALLGQVRTQYEVGVVSKVEVFEAEAGVAERDFNLIVAENEYRRAQDSLIDVVFGPELQAASRFEIDPTDSPAPVVPLAVDPAQAVHRAYDLRPELAASRRQLEILEEQLAYAKNQKLPKLDVVGTYGYTGLGGEGKATLFSATPSPGVGRNYWDANDDFFTRDGSLTWSARGVVSYPLGNETASARATAAALEVRRARTDTKRVEQLIVLEVRKAVRDVESSKQGIEAATRRQSAAAEQLRAERIRQEQGESTPFDVLQRERDFVDAEAKRIAAERAYRTSAAGLERAVGTILDTHQIVVEKARTLR